MAVALGEAGGVRDSSHTKGRAQSLGDPLSRGGATAFHAEDPMGDCVHRSLLAAAVGYYSESVGRPTDFDGPPFGGPFVSQGSPCGCPSSAVQWSSVGS
jgi:hypothetical protein